MYVKDGEKPFVMDAHLHFWDASPENWVAGQEQYAKGRIECFHAYQGLGPAETHWPTEKFQKYTVDDFERDVFGEGHVYGQDLVVPTIDVISREITFVGNLVGTYNDLVELMRLTERGDVTLHTSTYPLDAVNEAMHDLDGGRLQGRGILVPAGAA